MVFSCCMLYVLIWMMYTNRCCTHWILFSVHTAVNTKGLVLNRLKTVVAFKGFILWETIRGGSQVVHDWYLDKLPNQSIFNCDPQNHCEIDQRNSLLSNYLFSFVTQSLYPGWKIHIVFVIADLAKLLKNDQQTRI